MGWEVETTLETLQLGTRHDVGDLAAGGWTQCWRLWAGGLRLGTRHNTENSATGDWKQRWGLEMTLKTDRIDSGNDVGDLAAWD